MKVNFRPEKNRTKTTNHLTTNELKNKQQTTTQKII